MHQLLKIILLFLLYPFFWLQAQSQERSFAEVKMIEGVPALFINGENYPPFAYMSYLGEEQFYKEVASAKLHLYNIPAYLGDRGINSTSGIGPFRPAVWVGNTEYDFSSITKDFDEILKADPDAKVIIRFHLDPPQWWEKENPEEVCLLPNGESLRTSFFSEKWKMDAGKALQFTINWLLKSDYAPHLVGIHVAGGFTEEWFYHYKNLFFDESKNRTTQFRKWLRHKYGNKENLREAWKKNDADFNDAVPADISGAEKENIWRNPTDQWYFDTFDFHAGTMAKHIDYFCRIVKETSGDSLLAGAFYGYHYFVSDPRRGHGSVGSLLESPYLDYLSSPNDYRRKAGEDWAPMAAIKSIQLHGKLWLAENDTRTSITTLLKNRAPDVDPEGDHYSSGVWIGPKDMETSVSFLWKNLGRMLAYGYGGWWFDMWGGWFSHPDLLFVIQKAQEFHNLYPSKEIEEMEAEVAIVVDERLQFWDKSYGSLTNQIIGNRYALGKTGAPYDLYLRTDLDKVPKHDYKVIWLLGIMELNGDERTVIEKISKKGARLMHTNGSETTIYSNPNLQTEIYNGKLSWTALELGQLWESSGVHQYSDSEDVIYAGRGWLSIHSLNGGKRTINLPFPAQIVDPLTNKVIYTNTHKILLDLDPGSTKLFRIEPIK